MKLRNLLLSIFCLLITGSGLQAQYGLHLGQFSSRIWSQRYQPANITQGDFATFRYGAHGGLYLGNSQASLDGILVKGGFITEGVKDRIINELGEGEVLNGGFDLGVASVNVKFGESNQVWGFYIEDRLDAVAGFDNPNTFGLIMKGNGPYAGEMVADNGVFARVLGSRKIGVGTGWQFDKLNFGARINFVQGQRMLDLDHLNYELFTSTLGTKLDLKADYALNATEKFSGIGLFGMQGYGGSVDLGVTYALNEKIVLEGSVLDLGATVWKTQKLADQIDLEWEGVFITSLFEDSIPEILEREVDSLRNLVFPDTLDESITLLTPMSIRLGTNIQIGENGNLGILAIYSPSRTGAFTRLPLLNVSYRHEVIDGLHLGANVYGGGTDTFGFGAMGSYRLAVKDWKVDLALGADNFLGYLMPGFGRGFSFFGGIGVQL